MYDVDDGPKILRAGPDETYPLVPVNGKVLAYGYDDSSDTAKGLILMDNHQVYYDPDPDQRIPPELADGIHFDFLDLSCLPPGEDRMPMSEKFERAIVDREMIDIDNTRKCNGKEVAPVFFVALKTNMILRFEGSYYRFLKDLGMRKKDMTNEKVFSPTSGLYLTPEDVISWGMVDGIYKGVCVLSLLLDNTAFVNTQRHCGKINYAERPGESGETMSCYLTRAIMIKGKAAGIKKKLRKLIGKEKER